MSFRAFLQSPFCADMVEAFTRFDLAVVGVFFLRRTHRVLHGAGGLFLFLPWRSCD